MHGFNNKLVKYFKGSFAFTALHERNSWFITQRFSRLRSLLSRSGGDREARFATRPGGSPRLTMTAVSLSSNGSAGLKKQEQ